MKVFISYSHDNRAHRDWVLNLANRLRRQGIDAWIDRYEPNPPQGWQRWMEEQLRQAERILTICTEIYRSRFDGKSDAKGVKWEADIIRTDLYHRDYDYQRYIPILYEGEEAANEVIPECLKHFTNYRLMSGYNDLYRYLSNQPE